MSRKILKGTVVSNKMPKMLVVRVERLKVHPKYQKRFKVSKRFKAHYDQGQFQVGDKVLIEESRPVSKTKRWRVVSRPNDKRVETNDN